MKLYRIAILLTAFFGYSSAYYTSHAKQPYKIRYFKQTVDHFSFSNTDSFKGRYLLSTKHWNSNGGPIFFYAGNEGDITLFAENTGFMWELAPEFEAMVVFAEHRYYGKSLPYGKDSFKNPKYSGYLTSEQALADYADLLTHIKKSFNGAENSPIIAFGGSYGGMLAAWFRVKYPHIIQGSIAGSAPILQFMGLTPCNKFGELVTADYEKESSQCAQIIRKSWAALNAIAHKSSGLSWVNRNWRVCDSLETQQDLKNLKDYLTNIWTNLAMADYPYPANFLAPLPGYPVKAVCEKLTDDSLEGKDLLLELFKGISVYFNYTGTSDCLNYKQDATSALGDMGWSYQACTEMVMPFCYDGIKDFFEPAEWNFAQYSKDCYDQWGVMPRPFMTITEYGGKNIQASSNIVFSNGLLDPWSTGGVLKNLSSSLISVIIPEGAHHLDLRASNPLDPQSVIDARNEERMYIKKWINEYHSSHH